MPILDHYTAKLRWPDHVDRCDQPKVRRTKISFIQSMSDLEQILREVRITDYRITADYQLRDRTTIDPGVAIYFVDWKGVKRYYACDRYTKTSDNINAITHFFKSLYQVKTAPIHHGIV